MKNVKDFLSDLKSLDIQVWLDGTNLRCNSPKGVLNPELRTKLANSKAEIIAYLQQKINKNKIIHVNRDENLPLSSAQARLWFLEQLEEGKSNKYTISSHLKIVGCLDVAALEQTLLAIVNRHEILRTNFKQVNQLPIQIIHSKLNFSLPVINVQNLTIEQKSTEIERLIDEDLKKTFDLENDLLIRTSLLQIEAESYILLLTFHHIVFDAWSAGIFFKELSNLYRFYINRDLVGNASTPLPELSIQYADFTVWQKQWLSDVLNTQLDYWKKQLANLPSFLELPTDKPHYSAKLSRGCRQTFPLTIELTQKLRDLSRQSGTTMFMTLLAGFATLLHHYSTQEDIVIGSPIANRNQREIKSLIGFFVNTIVLRINLENNPTFLELLKRVRQVTLEANEYQDLPFEKLVEELQPVRDSSHSPLFQVMFSAQKELVEELELPGITLTPYSVSHVTETFDLSLYMSETQTEIEAYWEYNSDLFEQQTVERMACHLQTLLENIVEQPEKRLSELSVLSQSEQNQILVEWNLSQLEVPSECVHQLFAQLADETPDAVALVYENQQLTYRELNSRANQLGQYLQSLGVKPEVMVGICVERSIEMIVGFLGILKAGGAYIPLDPRLPQQRLAYIIEDTQTDILLTQASLVAKLPECRKTICLDSQWGLISQHTKENPNSSVQPNNLAYIIYTSGSTGKPKGVMIEHRSLMDFATVAATEYGITRCDRVLQFASPSFDTAVEEIYPTLTVGGTVVLRTEQMLLSSDEFWQHCRECLISVLYFPTAYWHQLTTQLSPLDPRIPEHLRLVNFGGEEAKLEQVKRWYQGIAHLQNPPKLVNGYGPTEATVTSTLYWINSTPEISVPIGRPMSNTQVYVLDKNQQPVPIGVSGELHIGGSGLARGYLHRQELTQHSFIPNPFPGSKSPYLYKTGDLVRYRADAQIEFLGRLDNQVKIRGFRIELGEIETVLMQQEQVQTALVTVREEQSGDKHLVAYVIPRSHQLTHHDLRQYLALQLPHYMVPSAWVMLDAFPLTPNGKIDYRALPTLTQEQSYNTSSIPPRTPTQELIADIIAIVLKRERVGIYDNFFELGGHSLLATQVISRLRETFKVEIPLRCLFESPTVAELEKVILKEQLGGLQQIFPRIVPMSEDTVYVPLSFAQSRLWFLDQLQGMTSTYNVAEAIEMTGNLNVTALEQAIQEIVKRHAILRTNFQSVNGSPIQIIHPHARLTLSVVDFPSDLLAVEQQLQHLVTLEAQQPFNLQQEVLVRTKLWRLNSEKHVLLLVMHHIVCDGWSMGIFFQELSVLYQAWNTGNALPLPELPIQYADYAVWQQKWLQELKAHSHSPLQNQINYWQQQLANAPPLLELPTDKPRKAMQTFRGSYVEFKLDADLSRQMKILSQQSGTTLFMTLLAGFASLLFRYTAQDDILIGSPVANRNRQEIESLIGFFVNTLVLRTKIKRHCQFKELLAQVRQVALGAYAHQDIPFEKIVEILQPDRNLSHNPLFQVMFDLEIVASEQLELLGLQLKPFSISNNTSKFDLSLVMRETQAGLEGYWEYNSDLFEHQTIARMASNFSTLLSDIAANPEKPVGELSLLTERERHQLLVEWNNTDTPYPDSKCIHQVFEEQVEQTPFSVAVVYEDQSLTYHELNLRANKIAHYLQTLGVGPEVLVGICVERSVEMVVGLLGILKAGGAYVPLDPEYPTARLSFMLLDAQVSVLLTQQRLVERLPEHVSHIVSLDTDWQMISQSPQDNPITGVQASNLAYVIYTSGSTGKPKGAMNTHRSICNRLLWMQQAYQLTASDAVLQKTTFCFDVSVWEFFWTLITGARLVVAKPEGHKDSGYLFNLIVKENITTLHFVPSMLQVFLSALGVEKLKSLKRVICSGEALPFALQHCFFKLVDAELHNLYGPTEAAIDVTFWKCQRESDKSIVPIGRPISNTQIYLLDAHLQPVPIGVSGELHIGGASLARGYLNRPELTLEKFIPNPFGTDGHSRLYKTGDLAKYLPSGNIEYLGRIDNQVKIRGFRIELGEIEAVLSQHPSVYSVVITARVDTPGAQRLVAYIVPQQQKAPTISELRQFLKPKLPEYMVPYAFVFLEALPMTANGKIDRRALPAPELDRELLDKFVAPRTPIEEILVLVWALVLKVEQVGIYDNFFELGGNSLLATQVISRLREAFQVELPLRCLFESPTVAQLEEAIAAYRQTDSTLIPPAIKPISGNAKTFPLSFAQLRLWFLEQLEENNAVYNIPFAFQLYGNLNIAILVEAIQEVVQRHAVLRTNFQTIQDTPIQIIHPTVKIPLPIVDLQHVPNPLGEAQRLATLEAEKRFDLTQDILVRTTLLCLSDQKYVLLVTLHHIISDGWSMGIFLQEISTLYKVLITNQPSSLPTLEIQYADYAVWQRQWLQELGSNDYSLLQNQLNYWKQQLSGTTPLLELPISKPRLAVQKFRGRSCQFKLNADLTKQIYHLSRSSGATLFMTLLAAFVTLLHRYSGQEDILVGSPIANRHYREIESLIGLFVNTLVLRTKIQDNPNFFDLLQQVRQTALDAYMHQDVPFEQVVEVLQPERSLSYNPLFQVMFVLQNTPRNDLDLPDVTLSSLPTEKTNTQFDLTLTLVEKEQELYGEWEYDSELFEQQTVERMASNFQTLLESIVAHPDKRLSELSVLSQSEQNQILVEWNASKLEVPSDQCIHQLFAQLADETPDAVALVYENQQLTYRHLNERANQLGQYLQSLGVKPEVMVGICVERSIEMIVGFLGILKAGGAYIPLDPRLPQQRLAYIIEDTQTDILLTQASLVAKLPECRKTICLDSQWGLISQHTKENPNSSVQPNNLAYIIYTSGSTGKPKGVMIEHRSLMDFATVAATEYGITRCDRVLQFASPSFDTAVEEIYPTLTVGGTVVLRTEQMLLSSDEFWQHCRECLISVLYFPTAYWHQLTTQLSPLDPRIPEHLRLVNFGGEEAKLEQVKRWYQGIAHLQNPPKLVNGYGPTEATVTSTLYWINSTPEISVPIGRPMSNTQVYVLDKNQQPVPIGVSGELHIGGSGLARGYLHRQELTQHSFIPNPFPGSKSPYLYKTGDLVRYRADAQIEFLGRLDNQVKIRGFRIELGEIETVLMQQEQVQTALVTVREEQSGDKHLVAYVIPRSHQLTHHDLRQYLALQLPHYMVPSAWVMLDAFPLTLNGKIDYRSLPTVEPNADQSTKIISPRDKVELHLTKIWSEVLNIYSVGVNDNFFDLGGHSLLTVSLMTKIQQQFGTKLAISTIFQNGTIEQQATLLRQQTTVQWSPLVAIQPHGTKPPLFCVHPGGGSVVNYVNLATTLGSDQPFYGLEALGFDEGQQPQNRVEQMATDYINALQTFQPHGPYFLAGWCFGCLVAFEMATQLQAQGEKVSFLAFLDIYDLSLDETLSDDLSLFMGFFGGHLTVSSTHLKQLDSNQQLIYAMEQAKQLKFLPPDFQLAQVHRLLNVSKCHGIAIANYIPQHYKGQITLFQALEGIAATSNNPTQGWENLADNVELHWVPGDHRTMLISPHVQILAEKLQMCLEQAKLNQ